MVQERHSLKFRTGLLNDHFEFAGRLSKIYSDGYVDRASTDLNPIFFKDTMWMKTP